MNSIQTARQIIEHERKEAKKQYDLKLLELRGMEAKVQEICPHTNQEQVPGFAELDPYTRCLDCGKEINDNRS